MMTVTVYRLPKRHHTLYRALPGRVSIAGGRVTDHMGESLPVTTVTLTTRTGLASLRVAANRCGRHLVGPRPILAAHLPRSPRRRGSHCCSRRR